MIDFLIYETGDGGELCLWNDDIRTIDGLTNQVYLALFGGNKEQDIDWFANSFLQDENKVVSNFEKQLQNYTFTLSGLRALENTIKQDLKYLEKYAKIDVESELLSYNKAQFNIRLFQNDKKHVFSFVWDGTLKDLTKEINCKQQEKEIVPKGISFDVIGSTLVVY